jgi:hypothetical protein
MKKIFILALCLILTSTSIVTATTLSSIANTKMQTPIVLNQTGTFEGSIGFRAKGNWTEVGILDGTYDFRNRFGRFDGEWSIQLKNKSATGTMKGRFGKHILIGRITIEGKERAMPIIGFLGFRNETFFGRFMPLIGPALYFKGEYTPN